VKIKNRKLKITDFTLIELLIVIGVSVMLIAILVTFNRNSDKNIILINERAKLVQAITTAKSLSIQTFVKDSFAGGNFRTCGYGVHFEGSGYFVFRDTPLPDPINSPCVDSNNQYTGDKKFIGQQFEMIINQDNPEQFMFPLDKKVEFVSLPGGQPIFDVVFIPPEPRVYFYPNISGEAEIVLGLIDNPSRSSVKINSFGRITTQ